MRSKKYNKKYEDRTCKYEKEEIGLISLFNGISTFVGYLMSKPY